MEKIRQYSLLHCETNFIPSGERDGNDLDELVEEALERGWELWGSPFYAEKGVYQAMVRKTEDGF